MVEISGVQNQEINKKTFNYLPSFPPKFLRVFDILSTASLSIFSLNDNQNILQKMFTISYIYIQVLPCNKDSSTQSYTQSMSSGEVLPLQSNCSPLYNSIYSLYPISHLDKVRLWQDGNRKGLVGASRFPCILSPTISSFSSLEALVASHLFLLPSLLLIHSQLPSVETLFPSFLSFPPRQPLPRKCLAELCSHQQHWVELCKW